MECFKATTVNGGYINYGFSDESSDTTLREDVTTAEVQNYTSLDDKGEDNIRSFISELKQAIDSNDRDLIKRKVKENPDIINKINPDFSTDRNSTRLLFYAISENKLEAVKELIASGADVDAFSRKDKRTAIHQACYVEDTRILEEILKVSSKHINTPVKCFTPLYVAIHTGSINKVTLLIKYGVAINVFSEPLNGSAMLSPLGYAVSRINIPIIKLLLEEGADEKKGAQYYSAKDILIKEESVSKTIANHSEMFNRVQLSPDELRGKKIEILKLLSKHGFTIKEKFFKAVIKS